MAEKKIEDYLHLYLGCGMSIKNKQLAILTGVSYDERGKFFIHLNDIAHGYYMLFITEAKPILRRLDSMTEEERMEHRQIMYSTEFKHMEIANAEQFRYLLSKHFDLFGLIESGLAIDKTYPSRKVLNAYDKNK